jgi:hypothetical protein
VSTKKQLNGIVCRTFEMSLKPEEPVTPVCCRSTPTSQDHAPFKRTVPPGIKALAAGYDRAQGTGFLD